MRALQEKGFSGEPEKISRSSGAGSGVGRCSGDWLESGWHRSFPTGSEGVQSRDRLIQSRTPTQPSENVACARHRLSQPFCEVQIQMKCEDALCKGRSSFQEASDSSSRNFFERPGRSREALSYSHISRRSTSAKPSI